MMHVVFLLRRLNLYGGTKVCLQHANILAQAGHQVSVRQNNPPKYDRFALHPNVRLCTQLPPRADLIIASHWGTVLEAYTSAERLGATAVHLVQGLEYLDYQLRLEYPLSWPGRQRHVWRLVLGLRRRHRAVRRRRECQAVYKLPTRKLVVSEHLAAALRQEFGQQSYYVPNGIEGHLFQPGDAPAAPPYRVFVVGPYHHSFKRVPDAVAAVWRLKQQGLPIRLIRASQSAIAREEARCVDEYHCCIGPEEMARLYRSCHAVLLASNEAEGFGLPAIEAMASGCPAVLTAIRAFMGYTEPCDYAAFVPVGDRAAMADALQRVLTDRSWADRLRTRGLQVARLYTWEVVRPRITEIYQRIFQDGHQPTWKTVLAKKERSIQSAHSDPIIRVGAARMRSQRAVGEHRTSPHPSLPQDGGE